MNLTHAQVLAMEAGLELDDLLRPMCSKQRRRPTHGTCCTCQGCGWAHDDCVCDWSPSTDIADAWLVVQHFQRDAVGLDTVLDPNEYGPFPHWRFRIYGSGSPVFDGKRLPIATAIGGTASLAISRCALLTTLARSVTPTSSG